MTDFALLSHCWAMKEIEQALRRLDSRFKDWMVELELEIQEERDAQATYDTSAQDDKNHILAKCHTEIRGLQLRVVDLESRLAKACSILGSHNLLPLLRI